MARMIVFCGNCAANNNWPRPSVRVTTDPCQICGSWDAIRKRKRHPRTGVISIEVVKLNNFEHRASMLPGTPEESAIQKVEE